MSDQSFVLTLRRLLMAILTLSTLSSLCFLMVSILSVDGFSFIDFIMLGVFLCTLPWLVIGFWNSIIGFVLLCYYRNPSSAVNPLHPPLQEDVPLSARTAIVIPVYNESPEFVFRNLYVLVSTFVDIPEADSFDIFLLSDSQDPAILAVEKQRFAQLKKQVATPERLYYRHRNQPIGYKAGNIRNFVETLGTSYDYFIIFDADSLMSGVQIVRFVRWMETNPQIGILQSFVVGFVAESLFTRIFQFGLRQGMRSYTLGSAWWQGDQGNYWGHNAVIRMKPFREQCQLPYLSGIPPWGGYVLGHDQVEAVLMRRAGYEVRVIVEEAQSYEANPPTIQDFIRRDRRWAQGNMQYIRLLSLQGVRPLGRLQLLLATWMYLTPLFWYTFVCLLMIRHVLGDYEAFQGTLGLILLLLVLSMIFTPKLMGILDLLIHAQKAQAYGGKLKILKNTLIETVHTHLMTPIVGLSVSFFVISLCFGNKIQWQSQNRWSTALSFTQSITLFWPHSLIGLGLIFCFSIFEPYILPWIMPILLSLTLAVPFAWLTSHSFPAVRFCAIPEEINPPQMIKMLQSKAYESQKSLNIS